MSEVVLSGQARYTEAAIANDDPPRVAEPSPGEGLPGHSWFGVGDIVEALAFSERDRVDLRMNTAPCLHDYKYRLRVEERYGEEAEPRDILEILPAPRTDLFVEIIYDPSLDLEPPNEETDEVAYHGIKGLAERWIVLDVLLAVKSKTNEQQASWQAEKDRIEDQLREQASSRDRGKPKRIQQVWHRTQVSRGAPGGALPWRRR